MVCDQPTKAQLTAQAGDLTTLLCMARAEPGRYCVLNCYNHPLRVPMSGRRVGPACDQEVGNRLRPPKRRQLFQVDLFEKTRPRISGFLRVWLIWLLRSHPFPLFIEPLLRVIPQETLHRVSSLRIDRALRFPYQAPSPICMPSPAQCLKDASSNIAA